MARVGPAITACTVPAMLSGLLLLSGCGGRDPVDTPVNWWHQLEGGAIAQQRPPPPGVDAPYPRVGTTPAKPPPMLSADLRASLTEHLVEQSNLSARLNASDPIVTPALPTAPAAGRPAASTGPGTSAPASAGTAPANPAMSSATLDAAEAPPAPPLPADNAAQPGVQNGSIQQGSSQQVGELAMPEIVPDQAGITVAAGPTPPIPAAPPFSPALPGFPVLAEPSYTPPSHPNYALAGQSGERLLFADGSDALSPGQDGTLSALATRRSASAMVFVHGFGDAASDAPAEQAQALTLAALRARTVAAALREHGVPAGNIRIRADAFGRGATAGLVD